MTAAASAAQISAARGAVIVLAIVQSVAWISAGRPAGRPVSPADAHWRIDPNRATPAELSLLPRVGPALAHHIVTYREAAGQPPAFRSLADLDRVRGIGPRTAERLAPYLVFPSAAPGGSSPEAAAPACRPVDHHPDTVDPDAPAAPDLELEAEEQP